MTWDKSTMKTIDNINKRRILTDNTRRKGNIRLFNQFEAVFFLESATPLHLFDNGNTSLGKSQAIPYAE